jgi:two-component system response regulator GlrR
MEAQRILIVDDEPGVLDVSARTLRKAGFEVVTATNAQTARVLLSAHAVDLLITDIRMPGESGISLLQTVHETNPKLPLMIMTAYPEPPTVDAALELNIKSFVVKPFNIKSFVSEVQRSLGVPTADSDKPKGSELNELVPMIIQELRQQKVPVLEGVIQRDQATGSVVLVPGDAGGAVPVDEFLAEYTQGERIYLIVLPHQ